MRPSRTRYLAGLGLALTTVLLLVLAAGALGIVGAGGAPDRPFLAVPAVLVLGTVAARLRPAAMAVALLATASAQSVVAFGSAVAVRAGAGEYAGASVVDVLGVSAMFVALFVGAAWLFHRADVTTAPADQS